MRPWQVWRRRSIWCTRSAHRPSGPSTTEPWPRTFGVLPSLRESAASSTWVGSATIRREPQRTSGQPSGGRGRTRQGSVPVVELRAAVVIGSGSASFEMLRYLVEVLPAMVTPRWVDTKCQPVAIRDVLHFLVGSLTADVTNRVLDVGGPEVLTYRQMMAQYAEVAGLRRRIVVPVPFLTPGLSSRWIGLVTPIPPMLARPLIQSLVNDVIVTGDAAADAMPIQQLSYREAVELALGIRSAATFPPVGPAPNWADVQRPSRNPPTRPGPVARSTSIDANGTLLRHQPSCSRWSARSVGGRAGTPATGCGAFAACSTRWSVGWACVADACTRGSCPSVIHSTSGVSSHSSRTACFVCAPRCAFPETPGCNGRSNLTVLVRPSLRRHDSTRAVCSVASTGWRSRPSTDSSSRASSPASVPTPSDCTRSVRRSAHSRPPHQPQPERVRAPTTEPRGGSRTPSTRVRGPERKNPGTTAGVRETRGRGGLEPPHPFEYWHLKPARLPFRHSPEWMAHASNSIDNLPNPVRRRSDTNHDTNDRTNPSKNGCLRAQPRRG